MSKRREQYEKGIQRLQDYFQQFYYEEEFPSKRDIDSEINAILALRKFPIKIHIPSPLNQKMEDYIVAFRERYDRYDDVLPKEILIEFVSIELDDEKKLHQYLRQSM